MIEICYTVVSVFHWYQGMTTVPKNHMDVYIYIYIYGSNHYVVEQKHIFYRVSSISRHPTLYC